MERKFELIKQAFEEHLSAINENTSEIQGLFDYLHEVEMKMDKLTSRLDHLQLSQDSKDTFEIAPLTQLERKVFLALYTEDTPLSYQELSIKTELPLSLVPECVSSLVGKGVPFRRSFVNSKLFLSLDPSFKEMQAKENLVNLSLESFLE